MALQRDEAYLRNGNGQSSGLDVVEQAHRDETCWREVKEILDGALDVSPEDRGNFLDRVCGGDIFLRRRVEWYLEDDSEMEGFVAEPIVTLDRPHGPDLNIGRTIGAFRLVRRIGSGGMGSVYLAERIDDEFQQEVAVKLLKPGLDSEEVVRRFRGERQILARLEHPNIARLLDGGTTEDGFPYFVMELIDGRPIDRFCRDHKLGSVAILELFSKVCRAVTFAHRNLTIHRDLKPGNILVTPEGEPKLLDFGIAKLLTDHDAEKPSVAWMSGRFLTPRYASPEQLRGEAVTTATDVFSLGAILYQLLTGRVPDRLQEDGERFPAPDLPGDLEAVVHRATAADPEGRYGSVEHLSDDIGRHIRHEPVLARSWSPWYRFGKLLRRHRLKLSIVAALVLLAGSLVLNATLHRRAESEHARFEREHTHALRLRSFLAEILNTAEPEGEASYKELPYDMADAAARYLGDFPDTHATVLDSLGGFFFAHDELGKARELHEKALALRQMGPGSNDLQVVESMNNLALTLIRLGDLQTAETMIRQALQLYSERVKREDHWKLTMLENLAHALRHQARFAEALEAQEQAMEMARRLYEDGHPLVARSLHNLALSLKYMGRFEDAEAAYREVVAMREQAGGPDNPTVAATLETLGVLLRDQGRCEEAEVTFRRAFDIQQRHHQSEDHPSVAQVSVALARTYQACGEGERSEAMYRDAIPVFASSGNVIMVAVTRRHLASLLAEGGDDEASEAMIREALDGFRAALPDGHWRIADAEGILGVCRLRRGFRDEGETLIRESYRRLLASRGESAWETRQAQARLAVLEP